MSNNTNTPTLGFLTLLEMLWGMLGKAVGYANQSMDVVGRGINAVDQAAMTVEDYSIYYRKSSKRKLEHLYEQQEKEYQSGTTDKVSTSADQQAESTPA